MRALLIIAIVLIAAVETAMLVSHRSVTMIAGGVVVAFVLYLLWIQLAADDEEPPPRDDTDWDAVESLDRWIARTRTLVSWADGSRGDWDKHLRPILAREFQMASGHRQAKDHAAMAASGRMLFGQELWVWVDPHAASYKDREQPAPGRAALDEILLRLERM